MPTYETLSRLDGSSWVFRSAGSSGGGLPTLGSAYDVLQVDAAGTAAEWTDVVRHTRANVNVADDANITTHTQSPDATSSTRSLRARNSNGYVHLDVFGDGVVWFGGGATTNAVWSAAESGGSSILQANWGDAYFKCPGGDIFVQTGGGASTKWLYLDAPTALGRIVQRIGTGYTAIQTTHAEGIDVSANIAAGTTVDTTQRLKLVGRGTTSSTYQIASYNSTGYYSFIARDDGIVGFGGSAAVSATWVAYESGGYSFLEESAANGMLLRSYTGNARLRAAGTGTAVVLEAPTTGGTIVQSVGTGYTVIQTTSESGVQVHNYLGVGNAPDAASRVKVTGSGSTSATYQLLSYNSGGYWNLLAADDGVFGFGGSPTTDGVWRAYDSGGFATLESANANGIYLHASVGSAYLRASASGMAVYIDAPSTSGTVVQRLGAGYTPIQTTSASGVQIHNYLGVGSGPGGSSRVLVTGAGTTSGTYQIYSQNSGGYTSCVARDDGYFLFGGSAAVGATWAAYETSGSAVLQSSAASGIVVQSVNYEASLRALGVGLPVNCDAPTVGGYVQHRIGASYTAILTTNASGVQVSNYLGVGAAPSGTTRVYAKGSTSTTGNYQYGGENSNGYQHFFVGNDGVIGFAGSAAANASVYAWEDGGDSIIEAQSNGMFLRSLLGEVWVTCSVANKTANLKSSNDTGGAARLIAGSSTPGYFAVHSDRNASLFSTGVASYGGGAGVLSVTNATTNAVIGNTAPTTLTLFAKSGDLAEYNPNSISTFRAKDKATHSDGTATVVCSIVLPNVDGYYVVRGEVAGGTAGGTNRMAAAILGVARVDAGSAAVSYTETHNVGGTGYTASLTVTTLEIELSVTAANGHTSVGTLEATGVALDITII